MNNYLILPILQVIFCLISFILHIIALPSNYWAYFDSRTELGVPEEHGNYGLWGLCSIKAPLFKKDCDPLDTFFRPPPHMSSAGFVSIIHAIILGIFFPFGVIRLWQILQHKPELLLKPKTIGITKITIVIFAAILSGFVLLLSTLRETISQEQSILHISSIHNYKVTKGWAFWLQVTVTIINLIIIILCAFENTKLTQSNLDLATLAYNTNFQEFSSCPGNEYINPYFRSKLDHKNNQRNTTFISTISTNDLDNFYKCNSSNYQIDDKLLAHLGSTSYNNPAFLDDSPDLSINRKFF